MSFVLASASPRRRALLEAVGLAPKVAPSAVDESILPGESPTAYALRVASDKARACDADAKTLVLAADTVVDLDGRALPKSAVPEECKRMLRALSGRTHAVHTAVVVLPGRNQQPVSRVVTTEVRFRALVEADIDRYVATGEPFDKAGAYGIQGAGGSLVASVRGSYTNVVGLPLEETLVLLSLFGISGTVRP